MKRKSLIIISSAAVLLFVILVSFRGQNEIPNSGEYITMRIYENFTVTSSKIIITYADTTHEIVDLAPFKFNDDYLIENNKIITKTLNKLRNQGYRITTSTSTGKVTSSRNMLITTFILEKQ